MTDKIFTGIVLFLLLPGGLAADATPALLGAVPEAYPAMGFVPSAGPGPVRVQATTESAGDGAALRFLLDPLDAEGAVFYYGEAGQDFGRWIHDYAGISFWLKGDGTSGKGELVLDSGSAHAASFPLVQTNWHKVFIPWEAFIPPVSQKRPVRRIRFGATHAYPNPDRIRLDRVRPYYGDPPASPERYLLDTDDPPTDVAYKYSFFLPLADADTDRSSGVSFYAKGVDGVTRAEVSWTWNAGDEYVVSITNKTWYQAFYIPWEHIPVPADAKINDRKLRIGVVRTVFPSYTYLLDRLFLYRDRQVEPITPTPAADPPGSLSPDTWLPGREQLAGLRKKLAAGEAVTLVVLTRLPPVPAEPDPSEPLPPPVWDLLHDALARSYPPGQTSRSYEAYALHAGAWVMRRGSGIRRRSFNLRVLELENTRLQAVPALFHKIRSYRPDLVVIQAGEYEIHYGSPEAYGAALTALIRPLLDQGMHVVVGTPALELDGQSRDRLDGESFLARSRALAAACRTAARDLQVPLVDFAGALGGRGETDMGRFYRDPARLNSRGETMRTILYLRLLKDQRFLLWSHIPGENP